MKTYVASLLKRTVAQPGIKPGSLVNHSKTNKTKITKTEISANDIFPSFLYSSFITAYASLSRSFFSPQPKDFFRLNTETFCI